MKRSPSGRGGYREGAGRPKKPDAGVSHLQRPAFDERSPVHVTLRVRPHVPDLRGRRPTAALRRAFVAGGDRFGVRLTGFSIQEDHLHLLVEADDSEALARGLQGLSIRMAKALNRVMRRHGSVFADRYDARVLRTPGDRARATRALGRGAGSDGTRGPP
jgi:REP-associated tyrosine transposase